jgi:hypothetical protein
MCITFTWFHKSSCSSSVCSSSTTLPYSNASGDTLFALPPQTAMCRQKAFTVLLIRHMMNVRGLCSKRVFVVINTIIPANIRGRLR